MLALKKKSNSFVPDHTGKKIIVICDFLNFLWIFIILKICTSLISHWVCRRLGPSLVCVVSWGSDFCTDRGWLESKERRKTLSLLLSHRCERYNFKPSQIGKDSMDLLSSFKFFNLHQILHCFLKLMEKIRVRGT